MQKEVQSETSAAQERIDALQRTFDDRRKQMVSQYEEQATSKQKQIEALGAKVTEISE